MSRDDFIDPGTGEIRIAALMAAYDEKCEENAALDFKIRQAARSEVALRKELAKQHMDDPRAAQIREVLEYWIVKCHKSARTKVPMDGVRAQRVRSRMNQGFKVEDLKLAIDGCALKPFVGPMGRVGENVPGTKREDDLELILRDEKYVERFQGYAREAEKAQGEGDALSPATESPANPPNGGYSGPSVIPGSPAPSRLPSNAERFNREVQKRVDRANERERVFGDGKLPIHRVLDAVHERTGHMPRATSNPDSWMCICPSHEDTSPSMRVSRTPEGNVVVFCLAMCGSDQIRLDLGLEWRDFFDGAERDWNSVEGPFREHRPRRNPWNLPEELVRTMEGMLAAQRGRAA